MLRVSLQAARGGRDALSAREEQPSLHMHTPTRKGRARVCMHSLCTSRNSAGARRARLKDETGLCPARSRRTSRRTTKTVNTTRFTMFTGWTRRRRAVTLGRAIAIGRCAAERPAPSTSPCPRMRPFRNGATHGGRDATRPRECRRSEPRENRARPRRFATSDGFARTKIIRDGRRRQRSARRSSARAEARGGGGEASEEDFTGRYSRPGWPQRVPGGVHRGAPRPGRAGSGDAHSLRSHSTRDGTHRRNITATHHIHTDTSKHV